MPKNFTSPTQKIGEIGENLAVRFLVKHNYSIIERNYTKKWGEIDIIAEKNGKLHFIEVKSTKTLELSVTHETKPKHRPEENMSANKVRRFKRVIQTYLLKEKEETDWQVDLAVVYIDMKNRKARVKILKNIIL